MYAPAEQATVARQWIATGMMPNAPVQRAHSDTLEPIVGKGGE